jgi:predicted secreted protein
MQSLSSGKSVHRRVRETPPRRFMTKAMVVKITVATLALLVLFIGISYVTGFGQEPVVVPATVPATP